MVSACLECNRLPSRGLGSPATSLIAAPSSSLGSSLYCPSEPGVLEAASAHTPGVRWSHIPGGHGRAHLGRGALQPWSRHYGVVACGWGLGGRRTPPGLRHPKPGGPSGDAT